MFGSKSCKNCGKNLKDDWIACPYCGFDIREKRAYNNVDNFGKYIEKEFEKIDKMFGPIFVKFPKVENEFPFKGGGISIVIKSNQGMKPQIQVRNIGDYRKFSPEVRRRVDIKEGPMGTEENVRKRIKIPKRTEEPIVKIERDNDKESITINLPDINRPENIEIRKLEQSLEIKAFANDKAYFKLIPIEPDMEISNKTFKDGILRIELVK
jgi:HSP20 family molecular chaperone IbpA